MLEEAYSLPLKKNRQKHWNPSKSPNYAKQKNSYPIVLLRLIPLYHLLQCHMGKRARYPDLANF